MVGSTVRRQLGLAVVVSVVVVAVGGAVPWLIPRSGVELIEAVLMHGQAAILFGAASLGLLSGHWVARTSVGFACAALLILALASAIPGAELGQTGFGPVMSTIGAALAVALLLAAAVAPEVSDAESFGRVLTRESGPIALLALVALTPVVDAFLVAAMTMPLPVRMMFSTLAAVGWLVAGTQVHRFEQQRLGWLPAVLVILAVEAVVLAFVGVWPGFLLVALGLKALAGVFALVGAAMSARAAIVTTTDGMTSMLQDLTAMRDKERDLRTEESERLHEVRSVLAGLDAATVSLRKYEDRLDPAARRQLEEAVGAELNRLNHLIDPGTHDLTEELELDLESVLMPVVVAEREQGLVLSTDLSDVSVRGRGPEIATLVSDLLENARLHAQGSVVRLTAEREGDVVAVKVRDWGPGMSPTVAQHVFERSYRGAPSIAAGVPGSGLGLYNARRLARQMHGDLHVRAPLGGGCCFVTTLPGAPKESAEIPEALDVRGLADVFQFAAMTSSPNWRASARTRGHDEDLSRSC